ncbi:SinR family protein [Brucella anthropi]|uniref:SinR family protein n=1 Tax=Brucella anthropi TaxID=529 RepID=UPI000B29BB96|nr:SinR family protein [Brucella anthropi]
MTTYSISYDLSNPGRDYNNLISKIKELGNGWCHASESFWFINSNLTCPQIRNALVKVIDSNDKLVVNSVGNNWATNGVSKEVNEWLRSNWQSACSVA